MTGASESLQYGYDRAGGLQSIADLVQAGAHVADYVTDAAGRLKSEARGSQTKTYGWNVAGRLTSVSVTPLVGGVAQAPLVSRYDYDFAGRRTQKAGPTGAVTTYVWGDGEMLEERPGGQPAGSLRYEYVGDSAIAVGTERLMHDALGTVQGRIGNGAPVLYRFDAWGGFRSSEPAPGSPMLAYAGQFWDGDAGLSYAQQRWYDARVGRFLSEDPVFGDLQNPSSLHAFGYANGNPLAFIDPLGEAGLIIGPGVLTVNPEAEARFRKYLGEQVKKLQRAWNKHFEKEGEWVASHGDMTGGVVTATGGQFAGGVLFAVPNLYLNTGDVVEGVLSIPVRAWDGCTGWVSGGNNEIVNLRNGGQCVGAISEGTLVVAGGLQSAGINGPRIPPPNALMSKALSAGDAAFARLFGQVAPEFAPALGDIPVRAPTVQPAGSGAGVAPGTGAPMAMGANAPDSSGSSADPAGKTGWKPEPSKDLDWRGSGKGVKEALDEAFKRTGVAKEAFKVTRWGKDANGKSFPVEWRAPKGAEVSIDTGHARHGPGVPHVGYQTPGKGGIAGHILLDEVPVNR